MADIKYTNSGERVELTGKVKHIDEDNLLIEVKYSDGSIGLEHSEDLQN